MTARDARDAGIGMQHFVDPFRGETVLCLCSVT
jgi:hypothetical protein